MNCYLDCVGVNGTSESDSGGKNSITGEEGIGGGECIDGTDWAGNNVTVKTNSGGSTLFSRLLSVALFSRL